MLRKGGKGKSHAGKSHGKSPGGNHGNIVKESWDWEESWWEESWDWEESWWEYEESCRNAFGIQKSHEMDVVWDSKESRECVVSGCACFSGCGHVFRGCVCLKNKCEQLLLAQSGTLAQDCGVCVYVNGKEWGMVRVMVGRVMGLVRVMVGIL